MTWRSFMDYVLMCELGQSDAITRNYDLQHLKGAKPGIVLDRAFARMGFDQPNTPRAYVIPTVAQCLRNMGYSPPDPDKLGWLMREWYTWDRIRKGELRQWPLKKISENPFLSL
jgi:hypothetical protein